ncbi:MAG: AzlC family ABC transporter permease [Proteobacteria bacterium]|nr:AzlC family ABC transporter permease [Desulfobacula sp.]MBU3953042.1 AzlC family ABC transporter permease [Pseudomonadota bacterium]MBU4130400.1 AzlC family ABC transporter permease [Pseudomonadota bacterium]
MEKQEIQGAIKAGIPIFIGYFPAAVAFGILAKTTGVSLVEAFLFSAVVFAGASQFIALNLLATGMGPTGIILTTLLVNFRHFLMSAYLSTRIKEKLKKYYLVLAFGVTDEVFSVLSFTKGPLTKGFVFALQMSAYSGWVSGTLCGYLLGGFMPLILSQSMGVALYSLLLAILMPELKISRLSLFLALSSGLLNWLLMYLDFLPKGWSIIVCILVIAAAGAALTLNHPQKEPLDG